MVGLGFLSRGPSFSEAFGVNAGGTVVVGVGDIPDISEEAFRWTQAGGMVGLGLLPGGHGSAALGVNADGTVVVGAGSANVGPFPPKNNVEAFRWAGGMV